MALNREDKEDVKRAMGSKMANRVAKVTHDKKPGWFERKYGASPAKLGERAGRADNAKTAALKKKSK